MSKDEELIYENCPICLKTGFDGHLAYLAILHYQIEAGKEEGVPIDKVFDKTQALKHSINKENVHENIIISLRRLEKIEKNNK